jgi:hypothetical protein
MENELQFYYNLNAEEWTGHYGIKLVAMGWVNGDRLTERERFFFRLRRKPSLNDSLLR